MFRPHHAFAAFTSIALATVLAAGCSDPEPPTPRVTFESRIQRGPNPAEACPESGTWFTIGSFGSPPFEPVAPIEDGQSEQQGTVGITCSVTPSGEGFNVRATARLTGATGGNVTIAGFLREQGPPEGQGGVEAIFSKTGRSGAYSSRECVVRFTSEFQGVAAGRVWGELDCPAAEAPSEQRTCQMLAQFRFENCEQ
jgi:hypothetical protein